MGILDGILAGGVGSLVESVGKVASDLITTDKERLQLALEDKKLDQQGDLAQIDVNKQEAASASLFVAGWRPAVGWAGAMGVWCAFVPKALVITAFWAYTAWAVASHWDGRGAAPALPAFPDLGITDLLGLLGSLLGMGYMRHRETLEDKARSEPLTPFKVGNPFKRNAPAPGQEEAP